MIKIVSYEPILAFLQKVKYTSFILNFCIFQDFKWVLKLQRRLYLLIHEKPDISAQGFLQYKMKTTKGGLDVGTHRQADGNERLALPFMTNYVLK